MTCSFWLRIITGLGLRDRASGERSEAVDSGVQQASALSDGGKTTMIVDSARHLRSSLFSVIAHHGNEESRKTPSFSAPGPQKTKSIVLSASKLKGSRVSTTLIKAFLISYSDYGRIQM
ncbi:unnamed protein product [Soboliphyme baturini]|uniref:Secreted protein n=1 Tax=Soboliphyme baturini TaxID=241478 RepID=A0A183J3Z5_9BILA|nr:unnamed protein product [Soboliphyme baturini]